MSEPLDLNKYRERDVNSDAEEDEDPFADLTPEDVYRERRITCAVCQRVFFQPGGRGRPRKYCSPECAERAKRREPSGPVDEDAPEPQWVAELRDAIRSD